MIRIGIGLRAIVTLCVPKVGNSLWWQNNKTDFIYVLRKRKLKFSNTSGVCRSRRLARNVCHGMPYTHTHTEKKRESERQSDRQTTCTYIDTLAAPSRADASKLWKCICVLRARLLSRSPALRLTLLRSRAATLPLLLLLSRCSPAAAALFAVIVVVVLLPSLRSRHQLEPCLLLPAEDADDDVVEAEVLCECEWKH